MAGLVEFSKAVGVDNKRNAANKQNAQVAALGAGAIGATGGGMYLSGRRLERAGNTLTAKEAAKVHDMVSRMDEKGLRNFARSKRMVQLAGKSFKRSGAVGGALGAGAMGGLSALYYNRYRKGK